MRSVYPSGADLATASAAMLPPAPGRFSTTTGCPRARPSGSASDRATTSGWPPGAKGTTIRSGFVGCQSASATEEASAASNRRKRFAIASVVQDRREPAFRDREVHALAMRVVLHLVALHLADGEITRLRMREVEAAHRRGGQHRVRVGERHVGVAPRIEQAEEIALLRVVGARGVTRRRANAAVLFGDEVLVGERLVPRVAPKLGAHAMVQMLGEGLGEAIGDRLQHDRGIVVVLRLEL